MKTVTAFLLGLSLMLSSGGARAEKDPAEFVKGRLKSFQSLVEAGGRTKLTTLRDDVRSVFDFDAFAKGTMGKRWGTISEAERKRFSETLRRLLESTYLKHPEKIFGKHEVQVRKGETQGEKAVVEGVVAQDDVDVHVVLKLRAKNDVWMVTDMVFDELSMLEDYKYQFISFLKKKSVSELIDKLSERAAENELVASKKSAN